MLADGRSLGYAEWGPPDARVVVYCHGFPGCRREGALAEPIVARSRVQARVVVLERPGYGLSTFQRRRRILDWPADVAEAADALDIGSFAVLGVSGGAPYALACALTLGERVTRVGIAVGSGPIEAPGMRESPAIADVPANPLLRRVQYALAALLLRTGQHARFLDTALRAMSVPDQEMFSRTEVREWFFTVAREALTGLGRGAAHEAGLYREPWGFDVAQVATPIHLWYAASDRNVPASVGEWLVARLPAATLEVWPGHGHYTWAMSDLVAAVLATTAGVGMPS
jgi:pimeloyl-ACP methyl ester carboxylesterase